MNAAIRNDLRIRGVFFGKEVRRTSRLVAPGLSAANTGGSKKNPNYPQRGFPKAIPTGLMDAGNPFPPAASQLGAIERKALPYVLGSVKSVST